MPITYAQGFVGVGAGPTGASFLQTNSGGSTAGTGSSVPQYTLDVVGSERVNGVRLFADGSAQVSAADALDYTTFGQNWTATTLSIGNWHCVAISANGQYQTVGTNGAGINYSSNYGQSWSVPTGINVAAVVNSIAVSASGQYQLAAVQGTYAGLYYSTNYGASWTASSASSSAWYEVCISASGQYASAVINASTVTYYSTNYGVTWTASMSPSGQYATISCSASGQYQVAATGAGTVYYSSSYGQSWSASNMSAVGSLQDSAMSASGQYVSIATNAVGVWYSSNYGQTFVQVTAVIGTFNLRQIAMSASGQYQLVSGFTGGMYYSTNYGVNWTQGSSSVAWYSVAISANGQYCIGCIYNGLVYLSVTRSPSLYTSGSIISAASTDLILDSQGTTTGWTSFYLKNLNSAYNPPSAPYNVSPYGMSIGFNASTTGAIDLVNDYGIGGFIFYNRAATSGTYAATLTQLAIITSSGLTVPGTINNAKLTYNSTFDTLYLGNAFPVGLATGAVSNTFFGINTGYSNTTGGGNTLIGKSAGYSNQTGTNNTCVGNGAGFGVSGFSSSNNSFFGVNSGLNAVGNGNTCIGISAGQGAGAGVSTYTQCTNVGQNAGYSLTTGANNTCIGNNALTSCTTGNLNTCVGVNAGYYNVTGTENVCIGVNAGLGSPNQSNSYNTVVGKQSLVAITTGDANTAIGNNVLTSCTTGFNNVAIGRSAGDGATPMITGSNNIYLGNQAYGNNSAGVNEIVFGNTTGNGSNTCTIKVANNGFYLSGYTSAGTLSNTAAGQVTSSSDIRVKSNIVYLPTAGSTDTIMGLKPVSFDLQFDPYKRYTGFIADEVQLVMPGCVDGKKHKFQWETDDEVDANGNIIKHGKKPKVDANGNVIYKKDENGELIPRYLGMDYNEVTSRLVLAFQEQVGIIQQQAITITNQTQTITALQSQLTAQQIQMDQILQRLAAANIA